jgi:acyl-CoA synthetase (AMP-forming)/AMP-acid ligase II
VRCRGLFWLTGQKKDLIIRGGDNIDPASIEQPLYRHPAIELAAAVGRPDPHVRNPLLTPQARTLPSISP